MDCGGDDVVLDHIPGYVFSIALHRPLKIVGIHLISNESHPCQMKRLYSYTESDSVSLLWELYELGL